MRQARVTVADPRRWRPWKARNWVAYGALLIVATAALLLTAASTPAHGDLQRYRAVASGEGMSDLFYSKDAPLADTLVDVRIPSAQATVDGLGTSVGFAGAPYPGDTVVSAPGLVASVLCSMAGQCNGLPDYPLVATSSYPSVQDSLVDTGVFRLVSHSTASTSAADATAGGSAQTNSVGRLLAHADAKADEAAETITADATSSAEVITLAGILRIGSVLASAHAELTPDGKIAKKSDVVVNGVTVAGVAAQITPDGIEIAGQKPPINPSSLTGALKSAGITVKLLEPVETATGVTSGAVVITQQQKVNNNPATHTYTLGGARADVVAVKVPSVTTPVGITPTTDLPTTGGTNVSPATPAIPGTTTPGTPASTIPAPVVQPPATTLPLRGLAAFAHMWTTQFYLILVVAGLVIVGAARLTTTLAVRRTWTS